MATVTIETCSLINSSTLLDLLTRQDLPKFTATIAMVPFTSGFKYDVTDIASRQDLPKFTATIAMVPFTSGFKYDVTDIASRRDLSFIQGFFDKPSGSTSSQFWS